VSHLKLKNPQTKANLSIKRTPEEGSKRKTSAFSYNEVCYESCSSADSNDPRTRTVLLRVHEEGKHDAHDCAPDKDQVQKACLVSEGVTKVAYRMHVGAAKVDWNLVNSQCNLDQTRTREAKRHDLVPSSYTASSFKLKAEINVGIPMTGSEKASGLRTCSTTER